MCRAETEERTPLLTPEEVVERIFHLVDENGDGKKSMVKLDSCFTQTHLSWTSTF